MIKPKNSKNGGSLCSPPVGSPLTLSMEVGGTTPTPPIGDPFAGFLLYPILLYLGLLYISAP